MLISNLKVVTLLIFFHRVVLILAEDGNYKNSAFINIVTVTSELIVVFLQRWRFKKFSRPYSYNC
jgi:hypothetical protein